MPHGIEILDVDLSAAPAETAGSLRKKLPARGDDTLTDEDLLARLEGVRSASGPVRVLAVDEDGCLELYRGGKDEPPHRIALTLRRVRDGAPVALPIAASSVKVEIDPRVLASVIRARADLAEVEADGTKKLELPRAYPSIAALGATLGVLALTISGKKKQSTVALVPGAIVEATVVPRSGAILERLEISAAPEDQAFVSRALRVDGPVPSHPWGELVPAPQHLPELAPPPPFDPARPLASGTASERIRELTKIATEKRTAAEKPRLLAALDDPANAGPALSSVRQRLISDLVSAGGPEVGALLASRLRNEDSEEVAATIAARASKYPQLLEQWARELAEAWQKDRRYARRIILAMEEDFARLKPEWCGPLPAELIAQLPVLVRLRVVKG